MNDKGAFVRGQGFSDSSCEARYPALMFQPRLIGVLVVIGLLTQWPFLFLALGAVLVWNVVLPRRNFFDALYAAFITRPRGLPDPDPAPAPRRFAQGMAATFMFAIGFVLLAGSGVLALLFETMLAIALAALIFGRFCIGSYLYHRLRGGLGAERA